MKPKKLIEVSLPIKEISAESVRDKSIRHGHISTLHLWWARRPLPVCRAIVFASLVPDPDDKNCPQAFRDAVLHLLRGTKGSIEFIKYSTYPDIPYTAVYDPMPDTLCNRLMMFIGKFSDKCQKNMIEGKSTSPKEQLDEGSLIKWENKNNPKILRIARELIWVAYNAERHPELGYETLHNQYEAAFDAIADAERALYSYVDRHISTPEVETLEKNLQEAIDNFQSQMPSVFDPFAGGGAIPLEAARLGCRSFGNDINPVAHIIERGSAEFPQRFGKPIKYSKAEFEARYGAEGIRMAQNPDRGIAISEDGYSIPNRLAFDVEFYAKQILRETESEVGYLYPADSKGNKPIAYYWARTARCSNPSCGAEVPLLKQFYLANTSRKQVYLKPIINGTNIQFEIAEGKYNEQELSGWNNRGNLICPCCGSITAVTNIKSQFRNGNITHRLLAVIEDNTGSGKSYRLANEYETNILNHIPSDQERPNVKMQVKNTRNFNTPGWGIDNYGDIFTNRQITSLNAIVTAFRTLSENFKNTDYNKSILCFLAIWIDRIAVANTSLGVWHTGRETLERIMGRQAIPMTFDYPESNPFCEASGGALNQLDWLIRYFESECSSPFSANFANSSSGDVAQFPPKSLTSVVTDPPYYDAIAYADISDFFYIWLQKTLGKLYPMVFATPMTPKSDECTALKHHHNDSENEAKLFFEKKLTSIFSAIETQTTDVVSVMYAHQSTEAWTTLCNSILDARMNITGSWPMDTEMTGALKTNMSYLESSVTVACRPSERKGFGDFKEVKKDIQRKVAQEVESLYELGFRGADLLTACFGQAVSEFGKYKSVEKADGSVVTVSELLELARNTAFDALLKGINADDYTRFYIGWLQLNGMNECDFDDASKFTRVGVNVEINDINTQKLLIFNGNKVQLATAEEHLGEVRFHKDIALEPIINQVHRAILLYREGEKVGLLKLIRECAPDSSAQFWRVLASLKELLPVGPDLKDVIGILLSQETLRSECQKEINPNQPSLFDEI